MQSDYSTLFDIDLEIAQQLQELTFSGFIVDAPVNPIPQDLYFQDNCLIAYSTVGNRDSNLDKFSYIMEDNFMIFGLFDGHGDDTVSVFLQNHLLNEIVSHPCFQIDTQLAIRQCLFTVQEKVTKIFEKGSTALIVVVINQTIIVANIGDSIAYGETPTGQLFQLNTQHNLQNFQQLQKVSNRGGIVIKRGKNYRLNGNLNLSRSIGDRNYKKYMSAQPQIIIYQKNLFTKLLLTTDGFSKRSTNFSTIVNQIFNAKVQETFQDNATLLYIEL